MQDKLSKKKTSLNFNGNLEDINGPKIFGILNLTPDSFYDGGQNGNVEASIRNVKKMLNDGADIIDVGAYSSRPGAKEVSEQEEIDRLLPTVEKISSLFPNTKISVDTFRSKVALHAIKQGAHIINDISGGDLDPDIWNVSAQFNTPYIAMHMQGTPENMQKNPSYVNVVDDILLSFSTKINEMKKSGLKDIIIDPGFGFGKTLDQNYEILKRLSEFSILEHPLLVGVSRKSMIYSLLNTTPQDALNGTTAIHMLALEKGIDFLRVHDVKAAKEAITIWEMINK
jgi:dihydropteroate synthase